MSSVIYVLRCRKQKFYVGLTTQLASRYNAHRTGKGSAWTALYTPTEVVETFPMDGFPAAKTFQEDAITLDYMSRYGIDNVRGGTFSQVVLPHDTIQFINKQIIHARGGCFRCGEVGHFANHCSNRGSADTMEAGDQRRREQGTSEPAEGGEGGEPVTKRRRRN